MSPNFLSKLVKQSSPSQLSPSPPTSSPRSRTTSALKKPSPHSAVDQGSTAAEDVPSDHSGPNFMIIPPSPAMTLNSLASSENDAQGENVGAKAIRNGAAGSGAVSAIERPAAIDDELTPTPRQPDTFIRPSLSTGNIRERALSTDPSNSSGAHGRFATVAGLGVSSSSTKVNLSKSSSKASLRVDLSDQTAALSKDSSTGTSTAQDTTSTTSLVESPTSVSPPAMHNPFSANDASRSTLIVPRTSEGDTASIRSVSSSKSKKPWSRRSSVSKSKTQMRSQSGLASAIAASGLTMAQAIGPVPVPEIPQHFRDQLPHRERSTSMVSRHSHQRSLELPMSQLYPSQSSSFSYQASEYSGISQVGSDSSSGSDDELDLSADNIPVTGFAVASNKRNADFHDQFPVIPEGDYLIEDYGCALQRDILVQGRLYISENHICFHANIFGWITDLSIPMYEIISLEKKMTAFVIPNAIQVTTRTAKYTFASFLSRDTTFDVIYNIWRLARPQDSRVPSLRGSIDNQELNLLTEGGPGAASRIPAKVTRCACGIEGKHFNEIALESVVPGTPEKIHNLMFASGFIKNFMSVDQKLIDLQISDWTPADSTAVGDSKLLARNMSYIKPLSASIGPKQTKCELRDEIVHCDFENYISTITTTRTPDVPSGNVFSVKTRTCITWASSASTRIFVTTRIEWSGRSFIKGIIEKSCIDGQKQYHADLDQAMRVYIQEHQSEFIPEGMDAAEAEAAQTAEIVEAPAANAPKSPQERERERNRRGLQWAYDTFDGAFNVAKQSTETALELVGDAWDQSSSLTIPWFIIVILVISNIWTLLMVGSREEVGRRKEVLKMEEREKWVQGVVTGIWDELTANRKFSVDGNGGTVAVTPPTVIAHNDWKQEIAEVNKALDAVEERIRNVRESLQTLD